MGRRIFRDREYGPSGAGYGLGGIAAFAIVFPAAGVWLILYDSAWLGIFCLLCGLAFVFMAYVFWTRWRH